MPINELIAGGIKLPQFNLPDYGADLAQMAQIQSARNQNALAQYQLGAAQRAEAKDVARTNALMAAGPDEDAIANALLKIGDIPAYSALMKAKEERQKTGLERNKLKNEIVDQRLKQSRAILDTFDPNDPNVGPKLKGWHAGNHADEYLGPLLKSFGATTENSIAEIDKAIAGGPAKIEEFLNRSRLAADKFAELYKPHLTNVTPGSNVINQKGEVVYTAPAPVVKPVVVGDKLIDPATGKEIYAAPPALVKPVVVGGRLVNPTTGQEIYAAPEKPVVVGGRLVNPATGQEIYSAPDKPVVVGNALVDPATGKQIYQGAPAPTELARLQAELAALPVGDPRRNEYEKLIAKQIENAPTNLAKLQAELAALPLGDPRRREYERLIAKEIENAPTDLAKLQAERDALIKKNPKDPLIAEYNARIKQLTTHPSPSVTNVNVSTERAYGGALASTLAKSDIEMRDAALSAPDAANNANKILEVLSKGNIIAGPGAEWKLKAAKLFNIVGKNNDELIANTEQLQKGLAAQTLDSIKTSGLGAGAGFTNADRDFLEKARSGNIEMTPETLRRTAELAHKSAQGTASKWNARVQQIPKSAIEGTGLSTEQISVPGLYGKPSAARGGGVDLNNPLLR
jgi:hypothetical protein